MAYSDRTQLKVWCLSAVPKKWEFGRPLRQLQTCWTLKCAAWMWLFPSLLGPRDHLSGWIGWMRKLSTAAHTGLSFHWCFQTPLVCSRKSEWFLCILGRFHLGLTGWICWSYLHQFLDFTLSSHCHLCCFFLQCFGISSLFQSLLSAFNRSSWPLSFEQEMIKVTCHWKNF